MKRFLVLDALDDAEGSRVLEGFPELARVPPPVEVLDDHRYVLDLGVDGVAENDGLEDRDRKHKDKGGRLAPHVNEFLEEDGEETAERAGHSGRGNAGCDGLGRRRRR